MSETLNSNANLAFYLSEATSQYSTEAVKAAIKQSTLNEEQIRAILTKKGLKGEILETITAELAEITATNGMSVAQKKATVSTLGLSDAFKGLWTFMKANPILFVAAGFTAVMAGVNAYNKYQEELAEKTRTATSEVKDATDSIEEYASKYEELYTELTDANTTEERQSEIKKELLKIQQELNEAYGDECGKINLVSDAYTNQIDKIKELSKEKAHQWLAENNEGIQQATKQMEKERTYTLGLSISSYDASGQAIKELAESFKDAGIEIDPNESTGMFDIRLKANAEDADKTISEFVSKVHSLKKQFKNDPIIDDVLNTSNNAGDKVQEILGKYQQQYNQAKMYQIADSEELSKGYNDATIAVQEYNDALTSGDDSKIKESRAKLEAVKNSIDLTSDTWKSYAGIINDVFDQADTRLVDFKAELESQDGQELLGSVKGYTETELRAMADDGNNGDVMDNLISKAKEQGIDSIEEIISLLKEMGIIILDVTKKAYEMTKPFSKSEMISKIKGLSEGFESLDKIMESQKDKNPFDYSLLDDKNFTETFKGYTKEYSAFYDAITESPNDVKACQEAYNDLVSAWVYGSGVLNGVSDETANLTTQYLSLYGVTNADVVVADALARQHAELAWNTSDLTDKTSDEIDALAKESESTDHARNAFKLYIAQKLLDQAINVGGDISALSNIVNALGIATSAWKDYYAAKHELSVIESATKRTSARGITYYDYTDENGIKHSVTESALQIKQNEANSKALSFAQELEKMAKDIDLGYAGGNKTNSSSGSGSSKQAKTFDWIQRKIEYLRDEYNKYKEEVDDTNNSYRTQLNYLSQAKDLLEQIIYADKQAESAYLQNWEEVSAGLSDELKDKIMSGHYSVDYFKDSESATKAKEAWDSYYDQYQKRLEDEKTYQDLTKSERDKKNEWDREQIDNLKEQADIEQTNYQVQQDYLDQAVSKSEELTSRLRGYSEESNKNWDNAKSKIKSIDIADIMNGTMDLTKYKDDPEYKKLVEDAIKAYEDKTDAEKELQDEERELEEIRKEAYEKAISYVEAQQDAIQELNNTLQSEMDLLEATGKYIGADYYEDLIDNNKDLIDLYEEQIELAQDRLDEVSEESPEYYQLKGTIEQCTQAILDAKAQQAEWNETIKRLPIDRLQTYIDLLENIKQDLQNFTDENSVLGLNPTKEQYQQFIDINQEELDSLIKQQEKLKDILGGYEYGSEKYNDVSGEIQDIDDQISSLIQSQLEYNDAILQIPITEMENYYNNLSAAKTALENAIAEDNARGLSTTIDQYNELHNITLQQLQALSTRRDALTALLSVYDKESDKYRETQDAINGINSEMSSLVQNQYQWNQEILNIPIDKLNAINDNLNSYASILDGVISDYESAITGVNSLLDDEIDKINELRDATEEEYEAKIKPLEDELNLLEKTNEARSVQIGLEQAQYNLEKAQNQKTTQVMRNGELVYEANQDDLRSAKQDLADAQYNKIKFDLETQIENLEEERDALLEGYDDQIEKLEDIKSKWSEIADEIQRAIDIQKATDFFGDGWQDKVLSGNDQDMYDNMYDLYQSALNQKDVIEEQISSNERLVDMMGEFVARYQDGSITYETAMNGINDMLKASENGFTALENLSSMMNLDNIHGLENIAASTQEQIAESAKLLEQYMQIVESNSNSVKGFETSWDEIKSSVADNVDALNNVASSMEEYLSAFTSNAEAIGQYTTTWEEMRKNIEEQVEALKKAAEALEKVIKLLRITYK